MLYLNAQRAQNRLYWLENTSWEAQVCTAELNLLGQPMSESVDPYEPQTTFKGMLQREGRGQLKFTAISVPGVK